MAWIALLILLGVASSHANPATSSQECTPGKHYCGSDLINMGYEIENSGSTEGYKCTEDKKVVLKLNCKHLGLTCAVNGTNHLSCSCSEPSKKLCGHELVVARKIEWPSTNVKLQSVYACSDPSRPVEVCRGSCDKGACTTYKGTRRQTESASTTQCTPGKPYCGDELGSLGYAVNWEEDGDTLDTYLSNSIFACTSDAMEAILQSNCHILDHCQSGTNQTQSHCFCGLFHGNKCGSYWLRYWPGYNTNTSVLAVKLDGLYYCPQGHQPKFAHVCEYGCNPTKSGVECETKKIGKRQQS